MGVSKSELEEHYFYDELVTMLDIYAYANADEKEKQRYVKHAAQYKVKHGLPVTREEAKLGSLFR